RQRGETDEVGDEPRHQASLVRRRLHRGRRGGGVPRDADRSPALVAEFRARPKRGPAGPAGSSEGRPALRAELAVGTVLRAAARTGHAGAPTSEETFFTRSSQGLAPSRPKISRASPSSGDTS